MAKRVLMVLAVIVAAVSSLALHSQGSARQIDPRDSEELKRLHLEDQADRVEKAVDWNEIAKRDLARLNRVKELLAAGGLHTANDYYRAAVILQHGAAPEDFLLAHEFCIVAMMLGKSDIESSSLAAAAEDRFLMSIERPQRYGTQYRSDGAGPLRLYMVGDGVTDELRRVMGVRSLAEAKAHEAALNQK